MLVEVNKAVTGAPDFSFHAPRIGTMTVHTDKIREVIGSGGKVIREIVEVSGAMVDINDDGVIKIASANGEAIQKGGKTGPNLYGLLDRVAGSADFKYGKSIVAAGEAGLAWTEADFVTYVADPKKFLAAYLDDSKAKSKMSFKLKKEEEAANVWAYLVSVGPQPDS